ncbi:MAG: hypothetical protein QG637_1360 [Chloroflexota bacterium]|nr:hypothetical protein [Chloroflexota bacterium]
MKFHPLLNHPQAVLISHTPIGEPARWDDFRRAARTALDAMQVELDGEKAVIKPNVTVGEKYADPDSGIGVHPGFVHGMAGYLREHGARRDGVYVLEDPLNNDDNVPRHWRGTGYDTLAQEGLVKLCCPTTYTCVKKPVPRPQAHPALNVSRLAVGPNTVLFNVPKLKTHNLAITTLCLKNLMGAVSVFDRHFCHQAWQEIPQELRQDDRPRNEWMDETVHRLWQEGLARRLADTAQVIQPALNIIEGVVGRDGTGFHRGRNYPLGLVIAGINMVAVDSVASYLMGFDPAQLIYLQMAAEAGLGSHELSGLRIYTVRDGAIVPCPDIETLRARPALRVIRGIAGEEVLFGD